MGNGLLSVKGDVKTLERKRAEKGMAAMTDDEKLLVKQTFRSSILQNFIQVVVAGIASIVLLHFF